MMNNNKDNNNINNNKDNKIMIKVTLLNSTTQENYATLMMLPNKEYLEEKGQEIRQRAIQTICRREKITCKDLLDKGFTKIGVKIIRKREGIIS